MDGKAAELNQEQQELLDSGLRMLAHMIVTYHLRRTKPDYTSTSVEASSRVDQGTATLRRITGNVIDDSRVRDEK